MTLTTSQLDQYRQNGFVTGLAAFNADEVRDLRTQIETLERNHTSGSGAHDLGQFFRVNGQLVIPLLARVGRSNRILDAVQSVLGKNLLVWSVELFIKEPRTQSVVSWHQDLTYWGMGETDEELTAWIALSDVSIKAGCMRFIPGSHKGKIVDHDDTFDPDNLLSRGQEIQGIDETQAVHGPLRPGEMSFHHGRCFHASGPNESDDRRIGLAIRYVTPEVRQPALGPDYAMLVRGCDPVRGWINVAGASTLFAPDDLALYDQVLAHQSKALAAGAESSVGLYQAQGQQ
ncbi:phytanoyl-CoA dioxygenase family protein [Thalassococcus lentus]|uniref:Phytanoyl-CoA dioxygenase family protein n=1 Tax=Thalassococcus lentus TaxID=1210524 RepID=A0ABT4XNE4_9RHOB|nr:phytanoyl-CoA dioxygenase family protein [Thalassococcus lentus]MDA7423471.1 phytanoyl-CoA dioxygenase family protein [Thalassococcus lentus]